MPVPRMLSTVALAPLLAMPVTAIGAELVLRDLHVGVEALPTAFDYQLSDAGGESSGSDEFSTGYGLMIGGTYSFVGPGRSHGPVACAALTLAQYAYEEGGGLDAYGVRGGGGYGFAFSDRWQFALLAHVGAGSATLDVPANSALPAFSADGIYVAYGANLLVDYAITDHWIAGLRLGYLASSSALAASGEDIDVTIDAAGPHFGLEVTYRFSVTPWRLE